MKTFISIIQLLTSLFLATQVWAWLRMLGSFWVNESLYIVESTFSTLFIVRFGVTSFIAILIPSAFVYWFSRKQTVWNQLIIYLFSGALFTVIYLLYVTEFLVSNIYYLLSNGPVILAAGVWASLVFFGINWLPIWETKNRRDKENFSSARRHIVSDMALTAGGVGLVGSLVGPYRILKKTGEYVELAGQWRGRTTATC